MTKKSDNYSSTRNMKWGFGLLAVLLISFGLVSSWISWQAEKKHESAYLTAISELNGRFLDAYFLHFENSLEVLAQDILNENTPINAERVHVLLARFKQANPDLLIVNLNRLDGQMLVSTEMQPGKSLPSMEKYPSFLQARDELLKGGSAFNIGRPLLGPLSKEWVIPLRYGIRDSQGKLLYMLGAVLPLSRQQTFWQNLSLPENSSLGLLRDDAYLVSRHPLPNKIELQEVYEKPRTGALINHLKQHNFPSRGLLEGYNSIDRGGNIFAYHRLSHYPLTLFILTPISNIQAKWLKQEQLSFFLLPLLLVGSFAVYRWTARRQLAWEREQEKQDKRFRSIFEGTNDAIMVLNEQGFLDCNMRTLAVFGLNSKEEFTSCHPSDFSPPFQPDGQDSISAAKERIRTALQHGESYFEWIHRRKNGEDFPADVLLSAFDYDGNRVLQATVRDITERKKAERAVEESLAQSKRESLDWIQAMDSFADVIYLLDPQRRLIRANKMFYAMTRTDPEHAVGQHIASIVHPFGEVAPCPVCRAQEEKVDRVITMEADHPDNPSGRPIEINVKILRDEANAATGILMSIHDLTNARKVEEKLRESERYNRMLFESSPIGLALSREDGSLVDANPAYADIVGCEVEETRAMNLWQNTPQGLEFAQQQLDTLKKTGRYGPYESEYRHKDGHAVPVRLAGTMLKKEGEPFILSSIEDITERRAAEAQIEFMAYHDALTGLPNRLLAKDHMELVISYADRAEAKAALMFLDLDNFKTINDSLGHFVGDALLKGVAARLHECVRGTDTLSRQGGDEFLIVLADIHDSDTITAISEKILERLADSFDIDGHELSISISIGVAVYPDDAGDFDTLLKKADTAMYNAKEAGRNTCRFYTEQMNVDAVENLHLRGNLRRALEHGEFSLLYQPQINLASGEIVGAEALIRWNHPELGMIAPGRFIPIAEECGLIVPIGEWVLREACRQASAWQQAGLPELIVAVNLSAVQFKRGDLERSVTQALTESGCDPTLLELELTESILIQNPENVLQTVKRLKILGVKFSIDDFGTGYSSLAYLKRFPVDKLKIDQSFVRDLSNSPENAAIVRAIAQMARSLNLKTIAEGVEDEQVLAFLRLHHCDEAQGYYFARPLPPDEFERYLARNPFHERIRQSKSD